MKMKAYIINEFGSADVFQCVALDMPDLKPGHVLIKIKATSINPIDIKIRSGAVSAIAPEFPAVLGADVAGVIAAVAPDVNTFNIGDEVFGCVGGVRGAPGALAEYILADSKLLAIKPKNLSMKEAAALPLVTLTAWEALFSKAGLTSGQTVLIHGGVGGVGHIAVQLAKWCGAEVYTTVRQEADVSLAKKWGARDVILSSELVTDYVARLTENKGFAVVFDTIGGTHLAESFVAASMNGHIATTVARATLDLILMHNKALSLHVVFVLLPLLTSVGRAEQGRILAQVATMVDEGYLKPMIDAHDFSLDQIADAHRWVESGQARGKVVLRVDEC